MNVRRTPDTGPRRTAGTLLQRVGVLVLLAGGCDTSVAGSDARAVANTAGFGTGLDLAHAQAVVDNDRGFPSRADLVALSDQLAMTAAGRPGAERPGYAAVVGDLRRHSYRTFHAAADAREAVEQFRFASRSAEPALACLYEMQAAVLEHELAGDPEVLYQMIYQRWRQAPRSACEVRYRDLIDDLRAFRPSPETLQAIERRLSSETTGPAQEGPVVQPGGDLTPGPARVVAVSAFGARDTARVVLELSGTAKYDVGAAGAEPGQTGSRLFLDFDNTTPTQGVPRTKEVGGLLERVRVGRNAGRTRVVMDLSSQAYRKVFFLMDPFRVVVDLAASALAPPAQGAAMGLRRVERVVLDPGHGGWDPGAIGPGGLREKDVVLDVAHRVAPVLARELGIVTMLTRDDDRYVALVERTARANAFHADLFVSLHCNASEKPETRGVQMYVLDATRDTFASRVVARENASSAGVEQHVGRILGDLRVKTVHEQGLQLASLLQRATIVSLSERYTDTPDGGVRAGTFYVLVGAQMPSVLAEISFISNPEEESRLATADYRQKVANGIANAIRAYREGK